MLCLQTSRAIRLQQLRMMIQEQQQQRIEEYKFIKGDYASVKIKMEPKSLVIDVPLDWEINKIKCLMVRMIPKLEFDMFVFKHDNEELDGNSVLRQLIELDIDEQCINSEHYILTFKKLNSKKFEFEKYYANKMKSLVTSLQDSPFQPILHPGYYSLKFISHLNQFQLQGGRDLIANFNQLQQLQNIVQEHRRQNQQEEGFQIGLGAEGNNRLGILEWVRYGFFRVIQVISLCTILNMVIKYSDIESFIIVAIVVIIYFAIGYLKDQAKIKQRELQKQQKQQANNIEQTILIGEPSILEKIYLTIAIFMVKTFCFIVQAIIAFFLSIFPNWDVQFHCSFFQNTYDSIQEKLNQWSRLISPPQIQPNEVPENGQKLVQKPQNIAEQNSVQQKVLQAKEESSGGKVEVEGVQKLHKQ